VGIVFYRLTSKVVGTEENCSEKSKEIAYYTLAIGHHTGVLDCFDVALYCDDDELDALLDLLPQEGYTYFKLSGLRRFGEITIEQDHAMRLLDELEPFGCSLQWVEKLLGQLEAIIREPIIYLVGRRLA
jgi:hydrogenase-4 component J